MKNSSKSTVSNIYPRFYARKLPRSLGFVLVAFGGFMLVMTILAMIQDDSILIFLASSVMALGLAAMFLVGVLAILSSFERIRVSSEGIDVCLGKLTLLRIPADRIRSVVATTKEYIQGFNDRQIYMLKLYWNGKHPKNLALWFQWSSETAETFQQLLPNVNYLL